MINELPNIFEISQGDENFQAYLAAWKSGVTSEVKFWDTWLEQRGGRWPDDFLSRFSADAPLRLRIESLPGELVRILDVGSGPVTNIGCPASGQLIEIVAVDPLAFAYNSLLDKHDLNPPLRTIMGFAEDLSSQFDVESFEYVHCCNALDHSYDPVRGIQEMLLVTKVEGTIILDHAVNEAIKANYDGLHQWNFDIHNKNFIVYNKTATYNITELAMPFAEVETTTNSDWIHVVIKKKTSISIDMSERQKRRQMSILRAIVQLFAESSQ